MRVVSDRNRVYVHVSAGGTRAYVYHGEQELPDDVAEELIEAGMVRQVGVPASRRVQPRPVTMPDVSALEPTEAPTESKGKSTRKKDGAEDK